MSAGILREGGQTIPLGLEDVEGIVCERSEDPGKEEAQGGAEDQNFGDEGQGGFVNLCDGLEERDGKTYHHRQNKEGRTDLQGYVESAAQDVGRLFGRHEFSLATRGGGSR